MVMDASGVQDPLNSTVISNRCLNNNLREVIKFHFLKLLPKVQMWNFNQNTLTTFHQNSYPIWLYQNILPEIADFAQKWFKIESFQHRNNNMFDQNRDFFCPQSRWGSIGGDFLVLVGGRLPWLWIWDGWSKSRILVIDQDYYVIPRSMIPTWLKSRQAIK